MAKGPDREDRYYLHERSPCFPKVTLHGVTRAVHERDLAHFKVPKRVIFVDSPPKNPSGKPLKRELRQHFVGGETLDKAIQKNFGT